MQDPTRRHSTHLSNSRSLLAIPVIDAPGASLSNFPKSHDLYMGLDTNPYLAEMDFALLVENEAPWYPPSNVPKNAKIVAIGSNPLKDTMVYQVTGAQQYLEGDTALTLRLLAEALRAQKFDAAAIADRRARWKAEHEKLRLRLDAAEQKAKRPSQPSPFRSSRGSCVKSFLMLSMLTRQSYMRA